MMIKKLIVILLAVASCSCSHVATLSSAEKKESAAIGKTDVAWHSLSAKEADYNREIKMVIDLPSSPQTQFVADNLLDLQYQLTGNAPSKIEALQAQVDMLLKDDLQAHVALKNLGNDNNKLLENLNQTTKERDIAVAKVNALANADAFLADKYDKLWDMFYALIALGILALVLRVLYAYGIFGATVASKV